MTSFNNHHKLETTNSNSLSGFMVPNVVDEFIAINSLKKMTEVKTYIFLVL